MSRFSGGRRIVKWTRSTPGSDFRMLRQARWPGCGSPDISRTRNRSRMPLIVTTLRLFSMVSSLRPGPTSSSKKVWPRWSSRISTGTLTFGPTVNCRHGLASRLIRITALSPGGAALSSRRIVMVSGLPSRPYDGADSTTRLRSRSFFLPVRRKWTGPPPGLLPASGASWICPSVIATMPARRLRGTSASARSSGPNSRVPSSLRSSPTRTVLTSRLSSPRSFSRTAARVCAFSRRRGSRRWLGDSSTTITAMSGRGSRISSTSEGFARIAQIRAAARARYRMPRALL